MKLFQYFNANVIIILFHKYKGMINYVEIVLLSIPIFIYTIRNIIQKTFNNNY